MTPELLLARLERADVRLKVDGDRLRFRAPKGALTPELRAALADHKEAILARLGGGGGSDGSDGSGGVVRTAPLAFSQRRLWFLERLAPGSPAYNIPLALDLGGALDPARLAGAISGVARRHEVLRTVFGADPAGGHEAVQRVMEPGPVALPVVDLARLADQAREREADRLAAAEASRPFSPAAEPSLRAVLVRQTSRRHLLLLTTHHLVADGWSTRILLAELAELYSAALAGRPPSLAPLAQQFADHARRQRGSFERDPRRAAELDAWLERLAGVPVAELPTDRPRPAVAGAGGAVAPFVLGPELTEEMAAFCSRRRVTLFMLLLAGFQALLERLSGEDDVAVGTAISNRNRPEIEGLIGPFSNNLVLRTDLSGAPDAHELVARTRAVAVAAYDAQDVPFEVLVERLDPVRDTGRHPLFQTMLTVQNTGVGAGAPPPFGDLELGFRTLDQGAAKFDLNLSLAPGERGISGSVEYRTDLYDASTIERTIGQLERLLEGMVREPHRPVRDLPLLGPDEHRRVVEEWPLGPPSSQGTRLDDFPRAAIAEHAESAPHRPAVVGDGWSLSYGELIERSDALAGALAARGVEPEERVGLCLERGPWLLPALLGVVSTGACYLPLDPAYPPARLRAMVEDAGVCRVWAEPGTADWLDALPEIERLEPEREAAAGRRAPGVRPPSDSLAYVLYTSGSTGRPKGVAVSRGALAAFLGSMTQLTGAGDELVLLAVTSLSFDISGLELWWPLVVGGRVELASRQEAADGRRLLERLGSSGATLLQGTPATWRLLLEAGWRGTDGLTALVGGEALPAALATEISRRTGHAWNVYGPTETTIWSSAHAIATADSRSEGPAESAGWVGLGRPLAGEAAWVLDPWGRPVPEGVAGEIQLGGAGVARGYLGRPALTAERFVPDALSGASGSRLYRTGDLGRWSGGGELVYLGRLDHQVKVRGHRIELGEIEAALGAHPAVSQAVVVAHGGEESRRLVAYWIGDPVDGGLLVRHLEERLPPYMVPRVAVRLDAWPLTPSGKVDRRALPEPTQSPDGVADGPPRPPRGVLEEMVAEVWREVLGVERVGAERSFFDLGGHSLLALRVMVRLGERLGSEPPLQRFFEHPTVAGLAAAIEAADGEGHGAGGGDRRPLPPLEPATSADGPTPASPAQERLAFLQRLDPESTAYNIASAVRLSGPLDRAALGRAVAELTRRQQVLRTRLVQEGRRIVQRVGPVPVVPVAWVDLSALSPAAGADAARRALARQAARPFDLELDAPLRAVAVRLGDREHHLGLTTHHAMADGVSLGLMLDEITTLYRAFAAGRPSPLGELEVQYGDVARWQHRLLDEGHLEGDLAYWRRALADAPRSLGLPAPGAASGTGGVRSLVTLEASRATAVRQLARDARASVFLVVLSAYAAWLRWLGRVDDLVIGLPVAARDDRRTERLVGLFVHTLPLRLELDGSLSFGELVARVRGAVMEGHRHRRVPLDRLAEELRGDERATGDALFEVAFTLQTQTQTPPPDPDGLEVEPLTVYAGDAAFALNVNAQDDGERIRLPLEVDTRRFEPVRVGSLARSLASFLEAAVAEPERSLDDLGTRVAEAERQARDAEHERLFAAREASRPGGGRRGRRGLRRAAPVAVALNPTPPRETE